MNANQEFYASHCAVSDPGSYAYLFENLPHDFAGVARIAQGLVYHYTTGQSMFGYCPPQERMGEIDTRLMEQMLARLMEMDDGSLDQPRSYANRLVGCCRDFALLACAILRHHGTPARLRYGFAGYFIPDYWGDHVIVEAWNGVRWQRFDAQFGTESDKLDIMETEYVTGGRAWQMFREGADPARFGIGPDVPEVSGEWFIRGRLLLDAAALNKQELLCWDGWSFGQAQDEPLKAEEEVLLDQIAALSRQADSTALRALFTSDPRLHVPDAVLCHSPAVGPHEVVVS